MDRIRQFLTGSNLWVAFAVACWCLLDHHTFNIYGIQYALFAGAATGVSYIYMRMMQISKYAGEVSSAKVFVRDNSRVSIFLSFIYAFVASLMFMSIFSWKLIILLVPAGLISLLYPVVFDHPGRAYTSLRTFPGLKIFLISFVWMYVTYLVPEMVWYGFDWLDLPEALFRMLFVVALTIPFDIRDIGKDDPRLRTLPQIFGVVNSLHISRFLVFLYEVWVVISFMAGHRSLGEMLAWIAGFELASFLLKGVGKNVSDGYVSFYVEGIPIFISILLVLVHFIV